jgi:hypothetical protein
MNTFTIFIFLLTFLGGVLYLSFSSAILLNLFSSKKIVFGFHRRTILICGILMFLLLSVFYPITFLELLKAKQKPVTFVPATEQLYKENA